MMGVASVSDPSIWRLTSAGGTPYRFLGVEGTVEPNKADATQRVIIPSNRLLAFLEEVFPFSTTFGNMPVVRSAPMPGLPNLRAKKLTFKSFDEQLPVDPFSFDPSAPLGTYCDSLMCEIEYGPTETQDPDPNNPQTFLEISGSASGEFLHTTSPKAKWQPKVIDDGADAGPGDVNAANANVRLSLPEPNRDPSVPISILVPTTEWTMRWNQIPYEFFRDVLIFRLRFLMGRVNSDFFIPLFNAFPGTILFAGYSYQAAYTWRDGMIDTPPINVELKFIEKRVVTQDGVIIGHNEFWRPGIGWQTLLHNGTDPTFAYYPFNLLFHFDAD